MIRKNGKPNINKSFRQKKKFFLFLAHTLEKVSLKAIPRRR